MAKTRKDVQEQIIKKAWSDENFKKALLADPKAAIEKETGIAIPANVKINVVQETHCNMYFVLPAKPTDDSNTGTTPDDGDVVANCIW